MVESLGIFQLSIDWWRLEKLTSSLSLGELDKGEEDEDEEEEDLEKEWKREGIICFPYL